MRDQEGHEPLPVIQEPLMPNHENERLPGVSDEERSSPKEKLPLLPRKQPVRVLGQTMPNSGSRSARFHHEEKVMHPKEEEIVRAIYQKHAHAFFDEMKESFAKESSQLRRQALKLISKSTAQANTSPRSIEDTSVPHEFQAELERLRQDVEALREASGQSSNNMLRSLDEKVKQQHNDLKAISKHLRTESAAVKKAALTPVWKERALQDIARGELRSVCEETCKEEISKIFQEFRGEFLTMHAVPVLKEAQSEAAKELVKVHGDLAGEVQTYQKEYAKLREEVKVLNATHSSITEELSSKAAERSLRDLVTKVDTNIKDIDQRVSKAAIEADEALQKLTKSIGEELAQMKKEGSDLAETLQSTAASDKEWKQSFEQTAETLQREIHTVREDLRIAPGGCLLRDFTDTSTAPVLEVNFGDPHGRFAASPF